MPDDQQTIIDVHVLLVREAELLVTRGPGELERSRPLELRAKGLPKEVIKDAQSQGLTINLDTKIWMEQMGLPYSPTHVNKANQKDAPTGRRGEKQSHRSGHPCRASRIFQRCGQPSHDRCSPRRG